MLEVASGTGQHMAHFAAQLPALRFQPSDQTDEHFASITAWCDGLENVETPVLLDVTTAAWPQGPWDVIYNANMVHIAPWEVCLGLMRGAAAALGEAGLLAMYGPYRIDGAHTAVSNEQFDQSLKARDGRWGVRDLEAVIAAAEAEQLRFEGRVQMPANNQLIWFRPAS